MAELAHNPPLPVTDSEGGPGKVIHLRRPDPAPQRVAVPEGAGAPARASVPATDSDAKVRFAGLRSWLASLAAEARTETRRSLWSDPAESLAEHARYVRSGQWTDTPLLIVFGWLYGWPAWAVSAAALGGVWLLRRPSRLFVATLVALVVWLTF